MFTNLKLEKFFTLSIINYRIDRQTVINIQTNVLPKRHYLSLNNNEQNNVEIKINCENNSTMKRKINETKANALLTTQL